MEKERDTTIEVIVLDEKNNIYFDLTNRYLYNNGKKIQRFLSKNAGYILKYLAINCDIKRTEQQIREGCGPEWDGIGGELPRYISEIRTALGDIPKYVKGKNGKEHKEFTYIKCDRTGETTYKCTKKIKPLNSDLIDTDNDQSPSVEACLSDKAERMDSAQIDRLLFDESDRETFAANRKKKAFDPMYFCAQWYKYYRNSGRYQGYSDVENKIDNEKTIISTEVISDGESEGTSLYDVLLSDSRVNNISLTAKGGYGKTFLLLQLAEKILADNRGILPFYVPLSELNFVDNSKENCIIDLISSKTNDLCSAEYSGNEIREAFKTYTGTILLLLDGLNEITDYECRKVILKSIVNLLKPTQANRGNIKMIVSSRYDFSETFSDINEAAYNNRFMHCQVTELSDSAIKTYLEITECGVYFDDLSYEQKQLLRTPQGLHMYVCLMKKGSKKLEFNNITELIGLYIERIFKVSAKSSYEKALQKIGYTMVKNGSFVLSVDDYENIVSELGVDIDCFNREIKNENLIAAANNYAVEFSHQNYRDYFCAKYIAQRISHIKDKISDDDIALLSAQDGTMSDEVLMFIADLLGEYKFMTEGYSGYSKVQNTLSCISTIDIDCQESTEIQLALKNLIMIARLGRKNDISRLKLNNLNLYSISLNGCSLYNKHKNHDGTISMYTTQLDNSIVSTDTFAYDNVVGYIESITFVSDDSLLIIAGYNEFIYRINENICTRNLSENEKSNIVVLGSFNFYGKKCIVLKEDNTLTFKGTVPKSDNVFEFFEKTYTLDKNEIFCYYDNGRIIISDVNANLNLIFLNDNMKIERKKIAKNIENAFNYCLSAQYLYVCKDNEIYRTLIINKSSKLDFWAKVSSHIDQMCFVEDANSIFVCENGNMTSSTITRISESSGKVIGSIEKKHIHDINGGSVFSGFDILKTDGKRLFCGIFTYIVGMQFYPIGDVCEIIYDTYDSSLKLVFMGHNLKNSTQVVGFMSQNTIVVYSRSNSILFMDLNNDAKIKMIDIPVFTGIGKFKLLSDNSILIGCLDGNLQKWNMIDSKWKCTDVLNLYSTDNLVDSYYPLKFGWKIFEEDNKIYTCFLGSYIMKLHNGNSILTKVKESERFSKIIHDVVINTSSEKKIIHALIGNVYYTLDGNLAVINRVEIPIISDVPPCIVSLGDSVYITMVSHSDNCSEFEICRIEENSLEPIRVKCNNSIKVSMQGIVNLIDSAEYKHKKFLVVVGHKDDYTIKETTHTFIQIIYQDDEDEWKQWSQSEIIECHQRLSTLHNWESIATQIKHNTLQVCACKKGEIIFMEFDVDNELTVLSEKHFKVDFPVSCAEILDNKLFVSDYNGKIYTINVNDNKSIMSNIKEIISTETGIISNYRVDLSKATFDDGEVGRDRFKGYFTL